MKYHSVPKPSLYVLFMFLLGLAALLLYVQSNLSIQIVRTTMRFSAFFLILLSLITLLLSTYRYDIKNDRLLVSFLVPIPHKRYRLEGLVSLIEISSFDVDDVEKRIRHLERIYKTKVKVHGHGDLVDMVLLIFNFDGKTKMMMISPERKDIFMLDLKRATLHHIKTFGDLSYHELMHELLRNDYRV